MIMYNGFCHFYKYIHTHAYIIVTYLFINSHQLNYIEFNLYLCQKNDRTPLIACTRLFRSRVPLSSFVYLWEYFRSVPIHFCVCMTYAYVQCDVAATVFKLIIAYRLYYISANVVAFERLPTAVGEARIVRAWHRVRRYISRSHTNTHTPVHTNVDKSPGRHNAY